LILAAGDINVDTAWILNMGEYLHWVSGRNMFLRVEYDDSWNWKASFARAVRRIFKTED
jgi:hypothetical protein